MAERRTPSSSRYAEAARRVDAGDACDGCAAGDGPFGAGNYDDLAGLPDAAVRVSLGCGNPVAVADLHPGETVLDLGSGGGIDVLLSARRVGPTGFAYGLDATVEMLDLARRNAAEAGATQRRVPPRHASSRSRSTTPRSTSSSRTASSSCPATRTPRSPRSPGSCAPAVVSGSATSSAPGPTTAHRPPSRAAPAPSRPPPTRTPCATPGSATSQITLTDAIGAGLSNAIIRATKPAIDDPPDARRGLAGGARHLRGRDRHRQRHLRDRGADLGALGRQPPRRPPPRRHRPTTSWSAGPRSARSRTVACTPASPRTASTSTPTTAVAASAPTCSTPSSSGAERAGYWTIQTGIFPENTASIATHERVGFRIVGRRERIGQLDGVWRDTLFLERRSTRI